MDTVMNNNNAHGTLLLKGKDNNIIKIMAKKLNYDCKKVIYGMVLENKRAEFAARKIQNWWRADVKKYQFILGKIWNAYVHDEFECLDNVVLPLKFLRFVATASDMEIHHLGDDDAVDWYLRYRSPCVYTKEFMDIFYDVEKEEEDVYDSYEGLEPVSYWVTSKKWLTFASYIQSCGGLDEWNWLQVFTGIMLDDEEKELFSCDTSLSTELKREKVGTFERKQIVYINNGFSPTLRLIRGPNEDICTKNYFLLAEVLKSGEKMSLFKLGKLMNYFIIEPTHNFHTNDNIENTEVFKDHILNELGNLISVTRDEHFLNGLCFRLLVVVFESSYTWNEDYHLMNLICDIILGANLTNQVLFKNVMTCGNKKSGNSKLLVMVMMRLRLMNLSDGIDIDARESFRWYHY